jgi:tRNA A-37 threonylcarbamoyl transferase component Bud32
MTQNRALQLIKKHRPENLITAHELGLRLIHIGSGAFRTVYRIKNTDLVIKFPDDEDGESHTRTEIKAIERLYKYKVLRSHLPKVYFYDSKSGVVVMEYYDKYSDHKAGNPHPMQTHGDTTWERILISKLIRKLTGVDFQDLYNSNLRLDKNQHVKFVDIGC